MECDGRRWAEGRGGKGPDGYGGPDYSPGGGPGDNTDVRIGRGNNGKEGNFW